MLSNAKYFWTRLVGSWKEKQSEILRFAQNDKKMATALIVQRFNILTISLTHCVPNLY